MLISQLEHIAKQYPFILFPSHCGEGWIIKCTLKPYKPFYGRTLEECLIKYIKNIK